MAFWTVLNQKKLRYTNIPAMSRFNNGPCIVIYDCLRLRYFQISELNESSGCHLSDRFVFYGNPSIIKSDWKMKDIFKLNNLSHSVHPTRQTTTNTPQSFLLFNRISFSNISQIVNLRLTS